MKPRPKYQLNLLKEEASQEDLFEDKTHERIANTLLGIIRDGDEGITIGLEGGWGSGKSTVVSILKQKLAGNKETLYFYFDAWAHEGDPLRRVFLESLIEHIGKNDQLESIKKLISNREKVTKIKSSKTITGLGKCISLAALLVPLGAALVSGTAREITINLNSKIHWPFLSGLVFVLSPLWVLLIHMVHLLFRPSIRSEKKLFASGNWMFLQGETDSTATQEISEDEERSSIEFERYFGEILGILFSKNEKNKLLIIADNLDRIDTHDSLKIWSTLQTFLQRKNLAEGANALYKKVWVLVPYDNEGLRRLWKSKSKSTSLLSKSFFDKCFQLRIEVPKPILTGWETFCRYNMGRALVGWSEQECEQVLDVLKLTRESVNDIPSPREIKTYINQVGLLRLHCGNEISIKAIAYYCVQKYLNFKDNKQIEDFLIAGGLSVGPASSYDLNRELCGILFGITPDKGYQLLLEPAINVALDKRNSENLKSLCDIHGSAFWMVFDIHARCIARPDSSAQRAMRYSWTVMNGLWEDYPDKCVRFIEHLKYFFGNHPRLEFPTLGNLEEYKAAFILLEAGEYDFSVTWSSVIELLKSEIQKDDLDYTFANVAINVLADCQKRSFPSVRVLNDIPVIKWMAWTIANRIEKQRSYKLIKPTKGIISEIAAEIKPGTPIPEGLFDLIKYLVSCGEKDWSKIIDSINKHITFNNGAPQNDAPSLSAIHILTLLSTLGEEMLSLITPIVENHPFYCLAQHLKKEDSTKYFAFLMAKCLPVDKFHDISFDNPPKANRWIDGVRRFWQEESENISERAKFIWGLLRLDYDYEFIWNLSTNKENKLIGEIIKIAVEKGHPEFFNFQGALELFSAAGRMLEKEDEDFINKLIKCFISHSPIEQEILGEDNLDIINFSEEIFLLVKDENSQIAGHIGVNLESVSVEEWKEALDKDTYLTSLAMEIKKKIPGFELKNYYCDALEFFLKSWISGQASVTEWQEDALPELVSILKTSFQEHLKNSLTNHLVDDKFKGNPVVIFKLMNYLNIKKIFTFGKEKLQEAILDFIQQRNFPALMMINTLLSYDKETHFKPHDYFPDVIRQPIIEYIQELEDIKQRKVIEELASKLEVDLTQTDDTSGSDRN